MGSGVFLVSTSATSFLLSPLDSDSRSFLFPVLNTHPSYSFITPSIPSTSPMLQVTSVLILLFTIAILTYSYSSHFSHRTFPFSLLLPSSLPPSLPTFHPHPLPTLLPHLPPSAPHLVSLPHPTFLLLPPLLPHRDTIHIEGVKLGFDRPVFFDRHAVGGEYGAGWKSVGAGRLVTTFFGDVRTSEKHVTYLRGAIVGL